MKKYNEEDIETSHANIGEDMPFQRREWVIERIGWAIGAFILVAALLGAFGDGPFSAARASNTDRTLEIEYPRFARLQSLLILHVTIHPPHDSNQTASIWLDREYFKNLQPQYITPEPASSTLGGDRITYSFDAKEATSLKITFHFTTRNCGRLHGAVGLPDQPGVHFSHFIYP